MRIKTYVIFLAWLFPAVSFAQDMQPFSSKVFISVSGEDNIKDEVESYISQELISLGDIIVTDKEPDWIIEIIAIEVKTKSGPKSGVDLSIVLLKPFNNQIIVNLVSKESKEWVSSQTSDLYRISRHWIEIGAPEDLRSICNDIVADFNSHYIQPARDLWQKTIDYQKTTINKEADPNK